MYKGTRGLWCEHLLALLSEPDPYTAKEVQRRALAMHEMIVFGSLLEGVFYELVATSKKRGGRARTHRRIKRAGERLARSLDTLLDIHKRVEENGKTEKSTQDQKERWQNYRDAVAELEWAQKVTKMVPLPSMERRSKRRPTNSKQARSFGQ